MRLRTIATVEGGPPDEPKSLTFETDTTACKKVGELIYGASTNPAVFDEFVEEPIEMLKNANIDPSQLAGLTIKVVRDDERVLHIVIPLVNKGKKDLDIYLQELGFVTIMGCR
ncbi:hypothetical protein DBIPINDM_004668 [Mesorhizobium sp. AR02]|uniref:hypothetical protein n=1 Tax=Mesorhizobium sp. AR02 TaxID=2865837 RepID=UPI00215F0526|nr:hypothetical protein [Mesorhizobium sp. AR02]UVK51404.1 hypothetical protein DBIPINDM_004668 [Mesorhizobium sp. AR02]